MKKAKENWIGEQCSEIEENLKKNNSKRAYELVKDLTTVKQGKVTTVQDRTGKGQWRAISTELYPDRHRFNYHHLQHSGD